MGDSWRERAERRSGAAIGNGRSRSASTSWNAARHAPMPRASDKIAAAEVTLLLRSRRQANTKSARSESSHKTALILPCAASGWRRKPWGKLIVEAAQGNIRFVL